MAAGVEVRSFFAQRAGKAHPLSLSGGLANGRRPTRHKACEKPLTIHPEDAEAQTQSKGITSKGGAVKLRDRKMVGGGSSDYLPDLVPALGLRDRTRRMLDIVTAMAGLMLFAPILLSYPSQSNYILRALILSRKILYGYKNRTIEVLKFRIHAQDENSRLTWLGCVVTQSGVDELLQLINVLRGEMSIFGRQNLPRWSPSIR
jgi:hypothetical protein